MATKKEHRTMAKAGRQHRTKKNGAGAYNWGLPGIDDLDTVAVLDRNDPNYVSDDETAKDVALHVVALDPQDEFKQGCRRALTEYLVAEDEGDVALALAELREPVWAYEFVKQALLAGVEAATGRERELISRLLSALYGSALPSAHIRTGFSLMLDRVDDTCLDVPDAPALLGNFLARAVVDDILPPAYLQTAPRPSDAARTALAAAAALLADGKQAVARIESIWGPAAARSTAQLKDAISLLLREYLSNDGDVAEAVRCLRELAVPHFHFEVVKRAVYMVLEKQQDERVRTLLAKLLHDLLKQAVLCERDVVVGFQSAVDNVHDICLDYGDASKDALLDFIAHVEQQKTVTPDFAAKCREQIPQRLAEEAERLAAQRAALANANKNAST